MKEYPMKRLLSKEEQEMYAWNWYEQHELRFMYRTFRDYVESVIGPYIIDTKSDK